MQKIDWKPFLAVCFPPKLVNGKKRWGDMWPGGGEPANHAEHWPKVRAQYATKFAELEARFRALADAIRRGERAADQRSSAEREDWLVGLITWGWARCYSVGAR